MPKPRESSRLICEGCGVKTEYLEHDSTLSKTKLLKHLQKHFGWPDDCPKCEAKKKAKKG